MVSIYEKDDFSVNDTGGSEKKSLSTPNTCRSQPITFGMVLIKF